MVHAMLLWVRIDVRFSRSCPKPKIRGGALEGGGDDRIWTIRTNQPNRGQCDRGQHGGVKRNEERGGEKVAVGLRNVDSNVGHGASRTDRHKTSHLPPRPLWDGEALDVGLRRANVHYPSYVNRHIRDRMTALRAIFDGESNMTEKVTTTCEFSQLSVPLGTHHTTPDQ
jgi:hypothetical protein